MNVLPDCVSRRLVRAMAATVLTLCAVSTHAVPFVSDGSDGSFAPTANTTINLSTQGDGGVFNFTTIDVPEHVTVRFVSNSANPAVVFGATGDVDIRGTIVVSAGGQLGGPGGGEGGSGGNGATGQTDGTGLAPGVAGGFTAGNRGGGGGGGGNATAGGAATSRTGPAAGAGGGIVAPQAGITGGSGGGGGAGGVFFGVDTSGGRGGGGGGGLQISTPGTVSLAGALLSDGAHGGTGYAIQGGPGGGGSGGNFEINAAAIEMGSAAIIRAIGGAGGGLSSESCTVTDPYRCSSFANGGLGYVIFDAPSVELAAGADVFAQPVGAAIPGFSQQNPLLPTTAAGPGPWQFAPIEVLPTAFGGFRGPSFWVDPVVAVGYDYAVEDARIASVELPVGLGDDLFEIWLQNPDTGNFEFAQELPAGEQLDLTSLNPFGTGTFSAGVDVLRVLGIDIAAELDPTDPAVFPTGLTFVPLPGTARHTVVTANLTMSVLTATTGGASSSPVPEPATVLLYALALGVLLWRQAQGVRCWCSGRGAGG